ncbi:Protein of unknown function [Pyronema omphalodes CBS 100304]|uniref:C2H2-type domain-containing protein n=1 Tax=Pyronema omphalodes (strain CBS 100304) TaxID=1076935 RepID=U4LUE3_PYROM|nr:Protein of unknown function [Pyronema omphalodes CBS 100304]
MDYAYGRDGAFPHNQQAAAFKSPATYTRHPPPNPPRHSRPQDHHTPIHHSLPPNPYHRLPNNLPPVSRCCWADGNKLCLYTYKGKQNHREEGLMHTIGSHVARLLPKDFPFLCRWQGCQIYLKNPLEVIHHIAERHIGTTEEKVGSYHTILESVVKAAQRHQESKNSTRSRNEVSATRNPSHDPHDPHGREPLGRQPPPHRDHNNTSPLHPPTMPRHQPRISNSSPSFACSWINCNHVDLGLDKVAFHAVSTHVSRRAQVPAHTCCWLGCEDIFKTSRELADHISIRHCAMSVRTAVCLCGTPVHKNLLDYHQKSCAVMQNTSIAVVTPPPPPAPTTPASKDPRLDPSRSRPTPIKSEPTPHANEPRKRGPGPDFEEATHTRPRSTSTAARTTAAPPSPEKPVKREPFSDDFESLEGYATPEAENPPKLKLLEQQRIEAEVRERERLQKHQAEVASRRQEYMERKKNEAESLKREKVSEEMEKFREKEKAEKELAAKQKAEKEAAAKQQTAKETTQQGSAPIILDPEITDGNTDPAAPQLEQEHAATPNEPIVIDDNPEPQDPNQNLIDLIQAEDETMLDAFVPTSAEKLQEFAWKLVNLSNRIQSAIEVLPEAYIDDLVPELENDWAITEMDLMLAGIIARYQKGGDKGWMGGGRWSTQAVPREAVGAGEAGKPEGETEQPEQLGQIEQEQMEHQ